MPAIETFGESLPGLLLESVADPKNAGPRDGSASGAFGLAKW